MMRYDQMVEDALRGVVREALTRTATNGRPGDHHFYISFRTHFPGVNLPDHLLTQYPEEMTIVIEHQFWDLQVEQERFAVTLSFHNRPERLTIPFASVTAFADPSVKFGLQFQMVTAEAEVATTAPAIALSKGDKPADKTPKTGEVVTLDAFRKK